MGTWRCATCGASNDDSERLCLACRNRDAQTHVTKRADVAHIRQDGTGVPPPPQTTSSTVGGLPAYLPEVRFATKGQWTSGAIHARPEGIFLLSAEDNIATPEKAASRKSPPGDEPLAVGRSQWIPAKAIARVTNNDVAGRKIYLVNKSTIPLRLDSGGWGAMRSVCGHMGIEFTT